MYFRVTKKVVIDPYRGGDDVGNTASGLIEKDFNLEVSKYIYNKLKELGVPVSITRDTDTTLDIDSRVKKIESFYGNGSDVIVISNALTSGDEGAEIVYALRNSNGLSSKIANEIEKTGQQFNKFYQRRLPSDTSKDYNQLIRDTANNESLIIYYGNVDNSEDLDKLINNKEELAEAVVIALAEYLNLSYTPTLGSNYYQVVSGDSLYSIAKKYNTTVSELKNLNNLVSNNLSIGQILKIPTETISEEQKEDYITYKVVSGDSLYSIANKYNTTVNEIKKLNNLSSNLLSIGQILKIPTETVLEEPQEDYITYKVVSGDSLYSIAKKYNTNVDTIKSLNNLTSNILSIGQILKIPIESTSSTENYFVYRVVSGDSLYSIAKKYNTSVDAIKSLNNLTSNLLSIGQTLKIPSQSTDIGTNYITYKVVSGDSLYSIAKKYNTSVDAIKSLNNLTSNLLSIGQTLKIPS